MEVQRRFASASVAVVGVTDATAQEARRFAKEHRLTFPILAEAEPVREAFGVDMIWGSVVFLVDPSGRVVADSLGGAEERLAEGIEELEKY